MNKKIELLNQVQIETHRSFSLAREAFETDNPELYERIVQWYMESQAKLNDIRNEFSKH